MLCHLVTTEKSTFVFNIFSCHLARTSCAQLSVQVVSVGDVFLCSVNIEMTKKTFNFAQKHGMPLYFLSAADGTNVVKVL